APSDGVTVQMDSTSLPAAMIGIPLPADPGQHTFKASGAATGDLVTVTFAEAAKQNVVLKVHPTSLPAAPAAPAAPAGGPAGSTATTASSLRDEPVIADTSQVKGSGLRIASYVSLGVGAAGLGVGTYFLVKWSSARDEANTLFDQCHTHGACQERVDAKDSDAKSKLKIGVGGLVVGGVGVVAGITMLILDAGNSSKSAQQNAAHVAPVVGFNTLGLAGTF
ncbi:MAG: hypothetical protein ABIQ16_08245, partial [Polyangiaceae bacterium]